MNNVGGLEATFPRQLILMDCKYLREVEITLKYVASAQSAIFPSAVSLPASLCALARDGV